MTQAPVTAVNALRRHTLRAGVAAALALPMLALGGCGFQLRRAPQFAFRTLLADLPDHQPLRRELKATLVASGVTLMSQVPPPPAPGPDAVLAILVDQREKAVVGSTSAGQVREFQLRVRFKFSLSTPAGKELIEPTELLVQRDISYSETLALSKADEEAEMYKDMQADVVQQLVRRLAAVRGL